MDALVNAQMQGSITESFKAANASDISNASLPRLFLRGAGLRVPLRRVPAVLLRLGAGGARCLRSSGTYSNGSSAFRWGAGDSEYLEAQVLEAGTYENVQVISGSL